MATDRQQSNWDATMLTEANAGNHAPLLRNPCAEPDAVTGMCELGLR